MSRFCLCLLSVSCITDTSRVSWRSVLLTHPRTGPRLASRAYPTVSPPRYHSIIALPFHARKTVSKPSHVAKFKFFHFPVRFPALPGHARHFSNQNVRYQRLTHIDADGRPNMVDVSDKAPTSRTATASGRIVLNRDAFGLLADGNGGKHSSLRNVKDDTRSSAYAADAKRKARSKGDVLTTAQLAAIMGSKQTSSLIPLCHPLPLTHVQAEFTLEPETLSVQCTATARCDGKTGVEMEALTAVSIGLLTMWDMVKAVAGKEMIVSGISPQARCGPWINVKLDQRYYGYREIRRQRGRMDKERPPPVTKSRA